MFHSLNMLYDQTSIIQKGTDYAYNTNVDFPDIPPFIHNPNATGPQTNVLFNQAWILDTTSTSFAEASPRVELGAGVIALVLGVAVLVSSLTRRAANPGISRIADAVTKGLNVLDRVSLPRSAGGSPRRQATGARAGMTRRTGAGRCVYWRHRAGPRASGPSAMAPVHGGSALQLGRGGRSRATVTARVRGMVSTGAVFDDAAAECPPTLSTTAAASRRRSAPNQ